MPGERGQASIEWIGAVLVVALALSALARVANRVEAASLAAGALQATTCAARGGCADERNREGRMTSHGVSAPPLLPVVPREGRERVRRPPRSGSPRGPRLRRSAGGLWRRAWLLCFGYERVRYGLLHPETRPRQTVPLRGTLQMVNDCVSPFDFARDWELLRPR